MDGTTQLPRLQLQRTAPPLCPVTALAFWTADPTVLLAGEDCWLAAYDVGEEGDEEDNDQDTRQGPTCLGRMRIFAEQPIQGCRVGDTGDVLVWGGRSVALLRRAAVAALATGDGRAVPATHQEVGAPDWIYDGMLPRAGGDVGALVTAHNEVVPWTVTRSSNDSSNTTMVLGPSMSPARPGLYAAQLAWAPDGWLVVAAGTAFGEMWVWTCDVATVDGRLALLDVFAGHEGSLFGVALSPALGLLVSCSDDRTLRAWPLRLGGREISSLASLGDARETGFPTQTGSSPDHAAARAVVMAHASRIWHVRLAATAGPSTAAAAAAIPLFSFGEDAAVQEWRLDFAAGCFHHVRTLAGHHAGKNIWAAAVLPRAGRPPRIATGGADGKICVFYGVGPSSAPTLSASPGIPPPIESATTARADFFNSYAFVSDRQILAAARSGRLFLGTIRSDGADAATDWTPVPVDPAAAAALQTYNVVRAPRAGAGLALLGTASGRLFLFAHGQLQSLATTVGGKVDDVLFVSTETETETETDGGAVHVQAVVTVLAQAPVLLDVTVAAAGRLQREHGRLLALPPAAEPMTVSAAGRCANHVVLGCRRGQLLVYDAAGAVVAATQTTTREAILAVVPLPPVRGRPATSCGAFVATARDGTYRIWDLAPDRRELHLCHETALPFGPIVRDAWWAGAADDPELVLCGFRSTHFVVWNESRQEEVAALACGGTHRTYAYGVGGPQAARLAYTRGGRLQVAVQTGAAVATVRAGGHGREIKAVGVSGSGAYVATGGEDTVVRLWRRAAGGGLRCLAVLKRHNTGLHGLAWHGDDTLVSAAGAEELLVWRVDRLAASAYGGLAVRCAGVYPAGAGDKTLRVTGMAARGGAATGDGLCITMALSNSTLQTVDYTAGGGWHRRTAGRYTGACPTHVRYLLGRGLCVLAAFTDGRVTVWKAEGEDQMAKADETEWRLLQATAVHRSAVKSLALWQAADTAVLLTGGDDNAVAITVLTAASSSWSLGTTYRLSAAHAAAVTGIAIVDAVPDDTHVCLTALSCSCDQRVKAWRVTVRLDAADCRCPVAVQLLDNRASAVADAADMAALDGGAMVVGTGMETWELQEVGS